VRILDESFCTYVKQIKCIQEENALLNVTQLMTPRGPKQYVSRAIFLSITDKLNGYNMNQLIFITNSCIKIYHTKKYKLTQLVEYDED